MFVTFHYMTARFGFSGTMPYQCRRRRRFCFLPLHRRTVKEEVAPVKEGFTDRISQENQRTKSMPLHLNKIQYYVR